LELVCLNLPFPAYGQVIPELRLDDFSKKNSFLPYEAGVKKIGMKMKDMTIKEDMTITSEKTTPLIYTNDIVNNLTVVFQVRKTTFFVFFCSF